MSNSPKLEYNENFFSNRIIYAPLYEKVDYIDYY